uniref:Uncharacterized protein n=1 Tax=Oryza punctata TaxID=4537 RepID=A0A0E0K1Q6_ORYPU
MGAYWLAMCLERSPSAYTMQTHPVVVEELFKPETSNTPSLFGYTLWPLCHSRQPDVASRDVGVARGTASIHSPDNRKGKK